MPAAQCHPGVSKVEECVHIREQRVSDGNDAAAGFSNAGPNISFLPGTHHTVVVPERPKVSHVQLIISEYIPEEWEECVYFEPPSTKLFTRTWAAEA